MANSTYYDYEHVIQRYEQDRRRAALEAQQRMYVNQGPLMGLLEGQSPKEDTSKKLLLLEEV